MTKSLEPPTRGSWPVALVIALLACTALVVAVKATREDVEAAPRNVAAEVVDLSALKRSTTKTRVKAAPRDTSPKAAPEGDVVHPRRMSPLFDSPDGTAFAKIGPKQFGDTWLPVIARTDGWVRVLLPSRPNGATGWLRTRELDQAHSRFAVRVHLGSRSLALYENGAEVGTWAVAVGAADTPTPTGRTFILGQLVDDRQTFSPMILPLGAHSDTLDSYGGGPGTVAIHGWTDPGVFGQAISHGCIRVPDDALDQLATVPIGTPVLIDEA